MVTRDSNRDLLGAINNNAKIKEEQLKSELGMSEV